MGIKFVKAELPPPRKFKKRPYKQLLKYTRPANAKAFIWSKAWIMVKVTSVYDGDTCTVLYLDNYKQEVIISVRLLGIDSAEMPRRKDESDRTQWEVLMAKAAKKRAIELLLNKICWLHAYKWDKWGGRILGNIYPTEKRKDNLSLSVSDILLSENLVVPYHGDKKSSTDWRQMWTDLDDKFKNIG